MKQKPISFLEINPDKVYLAYDISGNLRPCKVNCEPTHGYNRGYVSISKPRWDSHTQRGTCLATVEFISGNGPRDGFLYCESENGEYVFKDPSRDKLSLFNLTNDWINGQIKDIDSKVSSLLERKQLLKELLSVHNVSATNN